MDPFEEVQNTIQQVLPIVLIGPGLVLAASGLFMWLGGLRWLKSIAAFSAAIAGLLCAWFFTEHQLVPMVLFPVILASLGLYFNKVVVVLLGGATAALLVLLVPAVVGINKESAPAAKQSVVEQTGIITKHFVDEFTSDRYRVLIVEDSLISQKVLVSLLNKLKIRCEIAENGKAAHKAYLKNKYDLIFMNCDMPVMDGYESAKLIREEEEGSGKHIPILAFTAGESNENRKKCLDSGMDDFQVSAISSAKPTDYSLLNEPARELEKV